MKRILTIAALLASVLANAQERQWSLQECIEYALENNISIKQSEISVKQSEVELSTARGRRLPGLSASASENFSFGRGLTADNTYMNSNTTSTSFSLGTDIPVFQGFDITNGIKLSRLNLEAATVDLEKAKDDIRVAVAQAYVQILYGREMLTVATSQREHDEELLERVKARYEAGSVSSADVAAQQATLAQSRLSETQARGNLKNALLDLSQLLELKTPEGFGVVAPAVENLGLGVLLNPEEIFAEAVEIKPAVRSAIIRRDYAALNIKRAKGAYYPTLSLSGGLGTNYYTNSKAVSLPFADQVKNNFSQYIGLNLSIPIFRRLATRNQVRSAELSLANQELQLESVRKALYKEIQQAYYNAVAAQEKYRSSAESEVSSRMHYELTEEKYRNGKASIAEYNDARNSYLSTESDFLRARYECLFQTKLLDFYRGIDLQF